jgi:hypothetical protein
MTLRKLISASFFALILSTSALDATTTFGADDEFDTALERGDHPKTINLARLSDILNQQRHPFTGKAFQLKTLALPTIYKVEKDPAKCASSSDSDSEDCAIIDPPKRKKQKADNPRQNHPIYELDDEGRVVGNQEQFAEESHKNGRLEKIRSAYNLWSKKILRDLRLEKHKETFPYDDLTRLPENLVNYFLKDISVTETAIIAAAKKSPFLRQMLAQGMTEDEVNEMRVTDMVPLYDGDDFKNF